jgi:hypothetical protein
MYAFISLSVSLASTVELIMWKWGQLTELIHYSFFFYTF